MTEDQRRQEAEERAKLPSDALHMLDYKARFSALDMARSPGYVRKGATVAFTIVFVYLVIIFVLPWQQFVSGKGRVVALDPLERVQLLEAPISGRLEVSHVVEGQRVEAGQVLFEMADNDPNRLVNLETQLQAARSKLEAANDKLTDMREQLAQKQEALPEAIAAAQQKLEAARYAAETAALQYDRIDSLYNNPMGGLVSQREFELATLDRDKTAAELEQAQADRRKVELDTQAEITKIRAEVQAARSDSATAAESVASKESELARQATLTVKAPRDGVIFRVNATEGTFLSSGKAIATIVPETDNRMVELWVDGNDIPLVQQREVAPDGTVIQEGSPVRLQFEGWPAVQFIGWPSVARGTFGGEVVLIDPTDDGTGRFRVLVAPKPDVVNDGTEVVEWPGPRWLRQGVQANGWVLLQRVPLWYEIWRQLNGFPPALPEDPSTSQMASDAK
jgi:multidrug efflux pump subunit AcrA (membrane-fusion protein)